MSLTTNPGLRPIIHLDGGQDRATNEDRRTVVSIDTGSAVRPLVGVLAERAFSIAYGSVRRLARSVGHDLGILAAAVDVVEKRLVARAFIGASPGMVGALVVGRHSHADVLLPEDDRVSLRHLVVLVHPPHSWDDRDLRYSVHDLRTAAPFRDEAGRPLSALVAEGPAFLAFGRYLVFLLQTGPDVSWPRSAHDAFRSLPDRVYLDEKEAEPDRHVRLALAHVSRAHGRNGTHVTRITSVPGLLTTSEEIDGGGRAAFRLRIASATGAKTYRLGRSALQRGVLLGRYPRCDAAQVLIDPHISRAHLLLIEVAGTPWAVDCGSTEGTFRPRSDGTLGGFRAVPVRLGRPIFLGSQRASVVLDPAP